MKADGRAQRKANLPAYPIWSRDGRFMAYTRRASNGGDDLYVANWDGTRPRRIVRGTWDDNCFSPVWSPNGKQIAYQTDCEVDQMSVYVVNRDGSRRRRLISGTWSLGPRWSPDGRRILFARNAPPQRSGWFLFLVDPAGRQLRRIAGSKMNPDYNSDWTVSRDGRRIFLLTGEELFVIGRSGGRRRELASGLKIHHFSHRMGSDRDSRDGGRPGLGDLRRRSGSRRCAAADQQPRTRRRTAVVA